jgi:hypothetical protein
LALLPIVVGTSKQQRQAFPPGPFRRRQFMSSPDSTRIAVDLDPSECLRLLATADIGRVVYTERALPAVMPTKFTLADGNVLLRVAHDSRLATKLPGSIVAFQVDNFVQGALSGMSVLVTGQCRTVTDGARLGWLGHQRDPEFAGLRLVVLEIAGTLLTGLRIFPETSGKSRLPRPRSSCALSPLVA